MVKMLFSTLMFTALIMTAVQAVPVPADTAGDHGLVGEGSQTHPRQREERYVVPPSASPPIEPSPSPSSTQPVSPKPKPSSLKEVVPYIFNSKVAPILETIAYSLVRPEDKFDTSAYRKLDAPQRRQMTEEGGEEGKEGETPTPAEEEEEAEAPPRTAAAAYKHHVISPTLEPEDPSPAPEEEVSPDENAATNEGQEVAEPASSSEEESGLVPSGDSDQD